jgi:hypothetical protein
VVEIGAEVVGSEQDKKEKEKESYIAGLKNIRIGSGAIHNK